MRLANLGPIWKRKLLEIKLFGTYQTCDRRFEILEDDRKLLYSARARIGDGRKTIVFYNRNIASQNIQHEVDVMKVFFAYYPHAEARTGFDVDQRWKADMEMSVAGLVTMLELDRDTERLHQVKRRLKFYEDCPNPVIFVAPTERRMREVLAETSNPRIYFRTLDALLADPRAELFVNCLGEKEGVIPAEEAAALLAGTSAPSALH